ncbi:MAG: YncE family protein [Sandaracinus sp.]|nr:YncE family protein [Sandaracinus sp.]MCB9621936.1 YncE family protein [Sandaracinus sp.]MCB9636630.1 YncE family protein [Sandaracinus sp.]
MKISTAMRSRRFGLVLALALLPSVGTSQPRTPVYRTSPGGPALRVVGEVRTGVQPKSVEVSPDGRRVWVCNFGQLDRDNVWVYDAETLDRVGVVEFAGNAVETAFSPDGTTAYVSNFRRGVVEVIDTATFSVRGEVRVGANPKFMVVSPDGATLYVALYSQRRVAVVDTARLELVRQLRTGTQPRGMAIRPDGSLLVASFRSDFVQHFDASGAEVARFDTCPFPRHLQLGTDPNQLFVTCTLGTIGVYDVSTGRRVGVSPTGRNPRSLGLSADGRFAATANFHSSDVSLTDFATRTHRTSEVPGADQLVGLALRVYGDGPEGRPRLRIFATSWNDHTLFVLEPTAPLPELAP